MNEYSFFESVYEVVKLIPHGRVTSYGAIARYLGAAGSARMVGWAMNACQNTEPPIPAHRVVNRIGLLTGQHQFAGKSMQRRLEEEGIQVKENQIANFKEVFWDPGEELSLDSET